MGYIEKTEGRRKRVLFASKSGRRELEEGVRRHAAERGWIVESYPVGIPPNWDGDGVIADYYEDAETLAAGVPERVPWVTSRASSLPNRACVKGDVEAIAKMVADYFQGRGFRRFASFEGGPTNGPGEALGREVERRGLEFHSFYWLASRPLVGFETDFSGLVEKLGVFLRGIPKPCAVLAPGLLHVHPFYRACEREGLKVPQELAFLCNNDDQETTCVTDPTTSALVGEIHETGGKMVESLAELMAGRRPPLKLVKPSAIVTRQSTDILAAPHPGAAEAIAFLHRNYMNAISVDDAADAAGLSKSSLKQLFRRYLGRNPGELLTELRMNRARELLKEGALTLREIAERCGYGSDMALSLAFKRECGMTPGAFRKSASLDARKLSGPPFKAS